MKFLITFIILSIINVVFSTIRTITTVKSSKGIASVISGGYFAFYNIMLVYTVSDFPMWEKCLITFICNVIGVYTVKLFEEKARKDKLWVVQMTARTKYANDLEMILIKSKIPYTDFATSDERYVIFNAYCSTQEQSLAVKEIAKTFNVKYFVTESKAL
jgi:uncharacterized protein YebE (UPF0316 family)